MYLFPSKIYITSVPYIVSDTGMTPSFHASSFALERFACGWYGVGHTARRPPGGASHREAAAITAKMYESYTLERYDLIKQHGRVVFRRLEEATPRGSVVTPDASA